MTDTETKHTAYALARLADCASPDSPTSLGAQWLEHVARDFDEAWTYAVEAGEHYNDDCISEQADGLVPIYTHERWQIFTDLAAWQEDISEYGGCDNDLTQGAGVALYIIAERLLVALLAEHQDNEDE